MQKLERIIDLLESHERSYISPSAAMVMKDAREMLIAQYEELQYLRSKAFELEGQLINSKLETKLAEKPKKKAAK